MDKVSRSFFNFKVISAKKVQQTNSKKITSPRINVRLSTAGISHTSFFDLIIVGIPDEILALISTSNW
jgi:hypothetical protein